MKNKFIKIIILILLTISLINTSFALDETANINWRKGSVSKIYDKSKKKLTFLIQFKINSKPIFDYNFNLKIKTVEKKRICEGKFIYIENAIYTICSVRINELKTLDEKINLYFGVERTENRETQIEFYRNYNILKNIKNFDEIVFLDISEEYKEKVEDLHANGKSIVGKISLKDENDKFLDIKKYENFEKIFLDQINIAKNNGFDGIIVDNIDIYDKRSEIGFQIYRGDMEDFLIWLSEEVNERGMFLIQKNAPELSKKLEKYFDLALLEGAFYNNFEEKFTNYIKNKKTVINVEYTYNTTKEEFIENICPKSKELGFISILKNKDLDKTILTCENEKGGTQGSSLQNKIDKIKEKKIVDENIILENKKNIEKKIDNILNNYFEKLENKYSSQKIIKIINLLLEKINKIETNNIEKQEKIKFLIEKVNIKKIII